MSLEKRVSPTPVSFGDLSRQGKSGFVRQTHEEVQGQNQFVPQNQNVELHLLGVKLGLQHCLNGSYQIPNTPHTGVNQADP